jgi:MraZ protein
MALFLATHINRVDAKARVSVPAQFRKAIGQDGFQGIVVFKSHTQPALEGFSWERMEAMSTALDSYNLFSQEHDDFAMTLFGGAHPLAFDDTGRIVLPKDLADHAGISEACAFVGQGPKFQIWDPVRLEAEAAAARDRVRQKGLTLSLKPPRSDGGGS